MFSMENQWDLLVEHGFRKRFLGLWVEGGDPDELAWRLRVAPEARLECDLDTAMRWYAPYAQTRIAWIGAHTPGWTRVIAISGAWFPQETLSERGLRLFQVEYDQDVDGLRDLDYYHDGAFIAEINPPYLGEEAEETEYARYHAGLELNPDATQEAALNAFLCLIGRITGRFIDQDWFTSIGTLHRIPDGIWD
ncbi:hypothetical protein [Streptosporangium saharense]|uniref:hypothetical protein n=1 Tax=Streptosporangium saharense TaxID=1706840 RepID=UPI00367DD40F